MKNFTNLLNIDSNAKTVKGQKKGFLTGVLYLAPSDLAGGFDVCPMAKLAGCRSACLNTAGRGQMGNVQTARIRKTLYFQNNREFFMNDIVESIRQLIVKASNKGLVPVVRLNGTSDIRWEKVSFTLDAKNAKKLGIEQRTYSNIMEAFPNIQFYDYTKIATRDVSNIGNYDLTFSYSGVETYQEMVKVAMEKGMKMAVVFRDKHTIPTTWNNMDVVNGDETDLRFLDGQGVVVALYAKGKGVKDTSGFVVDVQ